jgi:hypothetical protein
MSSDAFGNGSLIGLDLRISEEELHGPHHSKKSGSVLIASVHDEYVRQE